MCPWAYQRPFDREPKCRHRREVAGSTGRFEKAFPKRLPGSRIRKPTTRPTSHPSKGGEPVQCVLLGTERESGLPSIDPPRKGEYPNRPATRTVSFVRVGSGVPPPQFQRLPRPQEPGGG